MPDDAVQNVTPSGDVTQLLSAWVGGDQQAMEQLMPLVYRELHRIARNHWNRQPEGHTLQPTALIHEAFLKLVGAPGSPGDEAGTARRVYKDRSHFFAVASMAMRHILVNHAETRLAGKRGGDQARVSMEHADKASRDGAMELLALHEALKGLEALDARKARVVELRFFGGLSIEETAEALAISTVTVTRDWQAARAWLGREIGVGAAGAGG